MPKQNETVVAEPWGFTEPFNWTASVVAVSLVRVTIGGPSVLKLNVVPDTVPPEYVPTALK